MNVTLAVFYRVVGATDGSSYSFGLRTGPLKWRGAILRYTGADPSAPINVSGFTTGDNNSPTAPAVTTTVADTMVVRIAGIDNDSLASVPGTELVPRQCWWQWRRCGPRKLAKTQTGRRYHGNSGVCI